MRTSVRWFRVVLGLLLAALGCDDGGSPITAPVSTVAEVAGIAFRQVSAGTRHTCGVAADDTAWCWGLNNDGQLGDGSTVQSRVRPVPVAGGRKFRQLSLGTYSTCGVTTSNEAYCWGLGGLLGDGTETSHPTPVLVGNGLRFRQVDVGDSHTCGISYPDNVGYCWGLNIRGALGDGDAFQSRRLTPGPVSGGLRWRQIAAGTDHTCGITTTNVAYCWGSDSVGQLGDNKASGHQSLSPTPVVTTRRFLQLDAGYAFTCAVTTTNKAFCWGSGRDGQVGDGKPYLRYVPRAVAGGLVFSRVRAGEVHACGETTDNRTYCWGLNEHGQLGDGTTTRRLTPVRVVGGLFFNQVTTGGSHSCGKTSGGVAYCWGWNVFGQVGDGTTTDRLRPVAVVGPS